MEKLIELLNEYEEKEGYNKAEWKVSENNQLHYKYVVSGTPNGEWFSEKYLSRDVSQAYLISSRYRFIKWLVENDKIDLDACEWEKTYNNLTASRDSNYSQYERLLMALAIQDEPIRFLCEILK